jgi:hypothetical protein
MKRIIPIAIASLAVGALFAADPSPTNQVRTTISETNQVKDAIAKLKGQTNYSWTATLELPGMGFTPSPMKGQAEKGGYALVSQEMNDNTLQAAFKGDKTVIKVEDQWQTLDEAEGFGAMMGWFLARTRTAADEADNLLKQVKALKAGDGGVLSGDLTDEGAKDLLSFGPRGANAGNTPPPPKNAKASVKFWLKDGALSKFESHVKGMVAFGPDQEERDMETIRTVEIQNVGATKVEVPAEAKKKLEAR